MCTLGTKEAFNFKKTSLEVILGTFIYSFLEDSLSFVHQCKKTKTNKTSVKTYNFKQQNLSLFFKLTPAFHLKPARC